MSNNPENDAQLVACVNHIVYAFHRRGMELIESSPCDSSIKWHDSFLEFAIVALQPNEIDAYQSVKPRCPPGAFNEGKKLTSNRSAWMRLLLERLTINSIKSQCTIESLKEWYEKMVGAR